MTRTRVKTTLSHWLSYTSAIFITLMLLVVAATATIMVLAVLTFFGNNPEDIKESYTRQHQAVQVFTAKDTGHDPQARKELAQSLLDIRRQGVSVDMLDDRKVAAQIKHIAKSGDRIDLNPKPFNFWKHNQVPLIVMGSITYTTFVVMILLLHLDYCDAYRVRYHHLPWRTAWPWVLVVMSPLMLWPIGLELWYSHQKAKREKQQRAKTAKSSV